MRKFLLPRKMHLLLIMFSLAFLMPDALAQNTESLSVSGVVQSPMGETLPGVTVTVKGTNKGTITDIEGRFRINVSPDDVLRISFIGMLTQEVKVGNRQDFTIILKEDLKQLDEVVVVGYGTMNRKDITGSVASVNSDQIKDIPLNSVAEALTGRLAGVHITTSEGAPGAAIQIRVRGGGSITQDNSPLYIVDGIQVEDALSILAPQEIESIDVLKDAAATAIYGARGANGVVIITTKGGKAMPTQVSYNGFIGARTIVNKLPVLGPYDYVMYQYQRYNNNQDERNQFVQRYGRWEDLELYKHMPFTDWQDEVFGRNVWNKTNVFNITGGSDRTSFNITLNNVREEGIMINSGFNRSLIAFKFDHKVSDKVRIGLNGRYGKQRIEGMGTSDQGSQANNRLRNAVRYRPFIAPGQEDEVDIFDPDFAQLTNLTNPVLLANNEIRHNDRSDINMNGYLSYQIIKNLTFKSVLGVVNTQRLDNRFNGSVTSLGRRFGDMPVVDIRGGSDYTLNNSNVLNYKTKIQDVHSFDFLAGQEILERNITRNSMLIKWLPKDITAEEAFAGYQRATPPPGGVQDAPSIGVLKERLLSFFGRAYYSYKDKYMATLSLRYDGSSKFNYENGFAAFPSASFAWRISDEQFMQSISRISDLKLRVSMGTSGNNRIDNDLFRSMYHSHGNYGYPFDQAVLPGIAVPNLANSNLRWETTVSRNAGADFSLFDGRLNGSVDFYLNNTHDLLLDKLVPVETGYVSQIQNVGRTENRGIELQLDGYLVHTKNFSWNANFNIAFNRNKIVSLGLDPSGKPQEFYLEQSGWVNNLEDFRVEVGAPIGQFYGYVTDGYYTVDDFHYNAENGTYTLRDDVPNSSVVALGSRNPQPGDLKLKKLSDDGNMMINTSDRTVLGNSQPKHIGGINQQFMYKNFDMSIFMNWSYGNKVYNANRMEFTTTYLHKDNNMLALMKDRWRMFDENGQRVTDPDQLRAMNENTKYWTPAMGNYFLHSDAIEDGSFLRISNLTIGYSLPKSFLERTKIFSKFRVYGTVNNLFTITGYSGYDPEANTRRRTPLTPGVDYAAYPRSRFILGGVNVTF